MASYMNSAPAATKFGSAPTVLTSEADIDTTPGYYTELLRTTRLTKGFVPDTVIGVTNDAHQIGVLNQINMCVDCLQGLVQNVSSSKNIQILRDTANLTGYINDDLTPLGQRATMNIVRKHGLDGKQYYWEQYTE